MIYPSEPSKVPNITVMLFLSCFCSVMFLRVRLQIWRNKSWLCFSCSICLSGGPILAFYTTILFYVSYESLLTFYLIRGINGKSSFSSGGIMTTLLVYSISIYFSFVWVFSCILIEPRIAAVISSPEFICAITFSWNFYISLIGFMFLSNTKIFRIWSVTMYLLLARINMSLTHVFTWPDAGPSTNVYFNCLPSLRSKIMMPFKISPTII